MKGGGFPRQQELCAPVRAVAHSPSDSSSSSSASFSRTSAGRVTPTAGVDSNITVSNPLEVLSAMVLRHKVRRVAGKNEDNRGQVGADASSVDRGCGGRAGGRRRSRLAATSYRCVRSLCRRHDTASCGASRHTWPWVSTQ